MSLDDSFQDAVRDGILDAAERRVREEWVPAAVGASHNVLRTYGRRNGYSVEPVIKSLQEPTVTREADEIVARWGWTHEAAPFFDMGVSPHTIEGDPILSFIWADAPPEVRAIFSDTERVDGDPRVFFGSVEHPGIPDSQYVDVGIRWLRRHV